MKNARLIKCYMYMVLLVIKKIINRLSLVLLHGICIFLMEGILVCLRLIASQALQKEINPKHMCLISINSKVIR